MRSTVTPSYVVVATPHAFLSVPRVKVLTFASRSYLIGVVHLSQVVLRARYMDRHSADAKQVQTKAQGGSDRVVS